MGSFSMLIVVLFMGLIILCSSSDYTNLVFKGCANQKFEDPSGVFSQALSNLFDSLSSQSSAAKFYNTTTGQGQLSITGLFQCRGDLSTSDCNSCVKKIPDIADKLCGKAVAARVQLSGCYLRYQLSGFRQDNPTELLYKICGSNQASGDGFQDRLDTALGEIAKGVSNSNGNGFYTGGYESVYVLGQCEGDLGTGDCVNCVKNAAQKSKNECGSSISAQIYLQECYISYSYYPNGVPSKSFSSPGGSGRNTQKTVAIILGGIVGFGLVIALLMFVKSKFKKKSYSKHGGY